MRTAGVVIAARPEVRGSAGLALVTVGRLRLLSDQLFRWAVEAGRGARQPRQLQAPVQGQARALPCSVAFSRCYRVASRAGAPADRRVGSGVEEPGRQAVEDPVEPVREVAVADLLRVHVLLGGVALAQPRVLPCGLVEGRAQTDGMVVRLVGRGPLLRAPAACWWARTIVESTETVQLRSSSASAWATSAVNTRSQVPSTAHIRSRL
ncbi:hypothetical protein Stube_04930 [Streptomyces tubercidicus]|uniref:Uncharacterized protein n=1 Tax=Streptomyces tubercidicus TaxID=47759 RepID=A0A640UJV8_9ACTN|nr:hypothetical protein Stube_04930 [Streptomyces tubercidicus]